MNSGFFMMVSGVEGSYCEERGGWVECGANVECREEFSFSLIYFVGC